MLHDAGHLNPVAFSEDVLADIETFPKHDNELLRQAAHEGSTRALLFVLDAVGRQAITTRILALRYVFRIEERPMKVVAKKYGVTKAAISKQVVAFADRFGLSGLRSPTAREAYARAQRNAWRSGGRKKKKCGSSNGAVNGAVVRVATKSGDERAKAKL